MASAATPLIQDAIHVSPRVHVPYFTWSFYHSIRMHNWVISMEANANVRIRVINEISHHHRCRRLLGAEVREVITSDSLQDATMLAKWVRMRRCWRKVFKIILNKGINNCYLVHGGILNFLGNGHTVLPDIHGGFINEGTTQLAKGAMGGPTGSTEINIGVWAILRRKLRCCLPSGSFRMATNKTCLLDGVHG